MRVNSSCHGSLLYPLSILNSIYTFTLLFINHLEAQSIYYISILLANVFCYHVLINLKVSTLTIMNKIILGRFIDS